jgi:hypothetical protein
VAKRFTDTDKWKRPWFRQLPFKAKLIWFYVLDNCDHCGVWPVDFELMGFQTGMKVTAQEFSCWFDGKFKSIGDDKFFFPSFVTFQQGSLTSAKNAHKPIIAFLEKHGLDLDEQLIPSGTHGDPIMMGPSKGIGIGISNGKGKEGGVGETKLDGAPMLDEWAALASLWPRADGRSKGVRNLFERHKSRYEFELFKNGIHGALRKFAHERQDIKFVPHFKTFAGVAGAEPWRDTIDWQPHASNRAVNAAPLKAIPTGGYKVDLQTSAPPESIHDARPDDPEARRMQAERMRELQATLFGGRKEGA